MKFTMTKIAAAMALTMAASGAQAVQVISMTLADVIDSNTNAATLTAGPDGLGTDGRSGAFRFNAIDADTYFGASAFSGDLNGGVITMSGSAPQADPSLGGPAFTSGFSFTGTPFDPYNNGAIAADITGGNLTFSSLAWAGLFGGVPTGSGGIIFNLPPDAGTLTVHNLIQTGANDYAYRIGWSHVITATEDPSGGYVGFNARWMLEGTMTTVPEPETYAMMVAGLGLVGAAVRRRRRSI
jgi:hypothetical protein